MLYNLMCEHEAKHVIWSVRSLADRVHDWQEGVTVHARLQAGWLVIVILELTRIHSAAAAAASHQTLASCDQGAQPFQALAALLLSTTPR